MWVFQDFFPYVADAMYVSYGRLRAIRQLPSSSNNKSTFEIVKPVFGMAVVVKEKQYVAAVTKIV